MESGDIAQIGSFNGLEIFSGILMENKVVIKKHNRRDGPFQEISFW